jgi:hypothetical protein
MGWTKRQLVTQALEEIGLAEYVFDMTPEQLQSACIRLDTMMATWSGKGIRVGYPLSSTPQGSDLDTETGVPDYANEAIFLNLGIRLAPSFGKTLSMDTKSAAKMAYDGLLAKAAFPEEQQLSAGLPRGAGNKSLDQPFITPPVDPLEVGTDGVITFE